MGAECTEVIIKGKPHPKQRPRFGNGHGYTPAETKRQEALVKREYMAQNGKMLSGAIEVEFLFVFEPPKSWSKKKRTRAIGMPKMTKPDNDNLVKLCLDALNGVAYSDDNRISKIISEKVFGEQAMTVIRLKEVEGIG